jgi:hypothetical protein
MRARFATISMVLLAGGVALATAYAGPPSPSSAERNIKQIVVRVQPGEKGLDYELETEHHKKGEANFMLAELKLQRGGDCQIIALVDDRVALSAITEISEMAINAGFKDIRPFVLWHKTGRIAQVQFGPPIKFTGKLEKIDERERKEMSK